MTRPRHLFGIDYFYFLMIYLVLNIDIVLAEDPINYVGMTRQEVVDRQPDKDSIIIEPLFTRVLAEQDMKK